MKKIIYKIIFSALIFLGFMFTNEFSLFSKPINEINNTDSEINALSTEQESEVQIINYENATYINGTLQWRDDNNNIYPLRNTYVELYNKNFIGSEYIKSGYTDNNGYIYFEFSNDIEFENGGSDIFIRIYTRGSKIRVYDEKNKNNVHYISTETIDNVITGTTYNCSTVIDMSDDEGKAFQVFQALMYGYDYSKEMGYSDVSSVDVIYPATTDGCEYNRSEHTIYIPNNHYKFWDEILHEFGHHLQNEFNLEESQGGSHLFEENLVDTYGLDKGRKLSWGEAWPTVFAIQVTQYYKDELLTIEYATDAMYQMYDKNKGHSSYNIDTNTANLYFGEGYEVVIFSILYDMYDSTSDFYDNIHLGHQNFWDLVTNSNSQTFYEFAKYCYNSSLVDNFAFYELLYGYGISPKNVELIENTTSEYYVPTISWTSGGPGTKILNNTFIIKFYDEYNNEILTINKETSFNGETSKEEYMLTEEEWTKLLGITSETIYCSIGGKISSDSDADYYYTKLIEIEMPRQYELKMDGVINRVIDANLFIWCKFTAPTSGNYEFYTSSNIDTFIEIFSAPVSSVLTDNLIKYDNNSGEDNNAKVKIGLNKDETIYLRIKNFENTNAGVRVYVSKCIEDKEFRLNCRNYESISGVIYSEYEFLIHKVNIDCAKSYTLLAASTSAVEMKLYDANMNLLTDKYTVLENSNSNTIIRYLGVGTYYLQVNFKDRSESGYLTTAYYATYNNPSYEIYYSNNQNTNNILTHLHKKTNGTYENKLYYINNLGPGFYNISVNAIQGDGTSITLPANSITIKDYDDETIINKYTYLDYSNQAINASNQNSMVVYLSRNGYFYIDINLSTNEFTDLYLDIRRVDEEKIDLFELSTTTSEEIMNETYQLADYSRKIILDKPAQLNLKITYNGVSNNNILLVVTKLEYVEKNKTYKIAYEYCNYINSTNYEQNITFNFDEGIYYIGYYNNNLNEEIDILLKRNISEYGSEVLVTDPNSMTECGSQINVFEKYTTIPTTTSYRGTNIAEGFTRLIYLDINYAPSTSRLDYNWYSSDTSVATISPYGTILGLDVREDTKVKIMAIYKKDPSIVYVKEFTITNDNEGYYMGIDIYVEHSLSEGDYKIELTSKNSPYPMVQYYDWVITDVDIFDTNPVISMDTYGNITTTQTGTYMVIGEYIYNPRFHIHLHLTITE